jgi:opacity protein-like surface antigen
MKTKATKKGGLEPGGTPGVGGRSKKVEVFPWHPAQGLANGATKMKTNTRIESFTGYFALAGATLCVLFGMLVSQAYAGSPEKQGPEPVVADTFNWSGFYMGASLGGVLSSYEFDEYDTFVDTEEQFFGPPAFSDDDGVLFFVNRDNDVQDGAFLGGGQIGYNLQFGHFVFGIEADFNRTSNGTTHNDRTRANFVDFGDPLNVGVTEDIDGTGTNALTDFSSTREAETNWMASVRARVGYAHGRFLFYATAGPAWADAKITRNDIASTNFFAPTPTPTPPPVPRPGVSFTPPPGPPGAEFLFNQTDSAVGQDDETRFGWTAGAGFEIAFNDAVSLGMEYRHNDFGSKGFHFADGGGAIFSESNSVDLISDQVTLRFNILLSHFFGH